MHLMGDTKRWAILASLIRIHSGRHLRFVMLPDEIELTIIRWPDQLHSPCNKPHRQRRLVGV